MCAVSSTRIRIVTPSLAPRDAIGSDVCAMTQAFSAAGYAVSVVAGSVSPACGVASETLAKTRPSDWKAPADVLIYHHSMGWPEGEELLQETRNRVVIRYHNITPARFFAGYSEPHATACELGSSSTARLARRPDTWFWGDSAYNCSELIEAGAPREMCRVLPPLHRIAELAAGPFDYDVLRLYKDGSVNILFVSGIKPNKGHLRAIRAFARYYWSYQQRSRLLLAGSLDPQLRLYHDELLATAAELGVSSQVVLRTSVGAEELRSLYAAADVFLSLSEHEGFGVPLVESMCFRVPIVAYAITAVPETVSDSGMLWEEADEDLFAASIDACVEDLELARALRTAGWRRYQSVYRADVLQRRLLGLVKELN